MLFPKNLFCPILAVLIDLERIHVLKCFINSILLVFEFEAQSSRKFFRKVSLAIVIAFEPQSPRFWWEFFKMPMDYEKGFYSLRISSVLFWSI